MFADKLTRPLMELHQSLRVMKPFVSNPVAVTPLKKVFVIDAHWDYNFHHMLTESVARLVYYLPMLQQDKSIVVHIKADELMAQRSAEKKSPSMQSGNTVTVSRKNEGACIRCAVLVLLGIAPERLVMGAVLAKQVLLPPSQGCSDYVQHPFELRKLAALLIAAARKVNCVEPTPRQPLQPPSVGDSSVPTMLRLPSPVNTARHEGGRKHHVRRQEDKKILNIRIHNRPCRNNTYTWRCWDERTARRLGAVTEIAFPRALVFHTPQEAQDEDVHAQKNDVKLAEGWSKSRQQGTFSRKRPVGKERRCVDELSCDIQQYAATDVLIAHHGAALTNVMFMKAGSLLVEVVGYFDGKMLPVCGIYGPLAAVFGVHHYIYYYDGVNRNNTGIDVDDLAWSVRRYYDDLERNS